MSSLTFAAAVSSAQSNAAATQREVQFMLGVGYGWGRHDAVSPFGIGVFLHAGYTALGGAYVGIMGDAYSGESREQADGHTDRAMIGLGAELGYDLRLSERWTLRFSLLNVAGALETIQCRQLAPPPSQQTCWSPRMDGATESDRPFRQCIFGKKQRFSLSCVKRRVLGAQEPFSVRPRSSGSAPISELPSANQGPTVGAFCTEAENAWSNAC